MPALDDANIPSPFTQHFLPLIVGTAGHIDHGKTSLVKTLTGIDADRLKEEKARGITIDLGFAYKPTADGGVLGFVDVPGPCRRRESIWPSWTCWA